MKNTLLLLLLLCSCSAFSYNQQSVYDFDIKHWGSTEGLSSNSVRSVSQDAQGYIWLATQFGLNRFDGVQFEHFTKESHRQLASNALTKLLHDSRSYMWVGTKAGLSGFDPLTLKFDRYQILAEVTAILEVRPGEIWVAADNLFRISNGKVSRVEQVRSQVSQLELVGNQVCHFMGHGLAQEVFLVFAVQLQVEAQQVLVQVSDAGLLAAQLEADFRAREGAFEEGFGLLVTGFDALSEQLGHGGVILLTRHYAASLGGLPSHRSAHSQRPPRGGPWLMPQCCFSLF